MNTFGQKFKTLRHEKELTQEDLSNEFNAIYHYSFKKSSISQYENNNRIPEIDALKRWAEYFDVSIDWLLGRTDVRNAVAELEVYKASKIDVSGLPDEAVKEILDFVKYIEYKYKVK